MWVLFPADSDAADITPMWAVCQTAGHLIGKAIDLRIEGKSARQTLAWVQKQPEVRYAYAIDTSYVHMDID